MKKMKAEKKRKLAAIIAVVLIASMILSAALPLFWASANAAPVLSNDYTIEATAGFGGYAKIGSSIPITVTVTNNSNKNFNGEVSFMSVCDTDFSSSKSQYNQFARSVEIAAGGSKTVSFNAPVKYIQREISIQLTKGKNVVAQQSCPISVGSDEDCWVGLLSDSPDYLTYLKPGYYTSSNGPVVDLTDTFGMATVNLDCVNVFVANDYDFAAMSDGQLSELLGTVNNGSVMLVGNKSRIGSIDRLGLDNMPESSLAVSYDGGLNIPSNKAFECHKAGRGYIILLDCDFADVNAVSSDPFAMQIVDIAYSCSEENTLRESIDENFIGYTDRLPNLTDNTIKVIFAIIYIYVAFIPVLYVILKRKDKRENALKIIPAAAFGISILVYLVSFNTVYKKPIASVINYVDLRSASGGNAALKTYMNIVSPSKGDIDIVPEGNPEIIDVSNYNYNRYYGGYNSAAGMPQNDDKKEVVARIITSDSGSVIEQSGKTKWGSTYLTLGGSYAVNGGFDGTVSIDANGIITGELINNTGVDFTEAVFILVGDDGIYDMYKLEDIDDGGSIRIDELGINISALTPKSLYEFDDVVYPNTIRFDRRNNVENSYRLEMEQDIVEGICSEYDSGSKSNYTDISLKAVVLGFSTDVIYGADTTVKNKKLKANCTNVFRAEKEVDLSALAGANTLGSSYVPELESTDTAEIEDDELFVYNLYDNVELSFGNPNREAFRINWYNDADNTYIYNNMTNRWDDLENNEKFIAADAADFYTDADGKIRIKAAGFQDNYVPLPTIKYYN